MTCKCLRLVYLSSQHCFKGKDETWHVNYADEVKTLTCRYHKSAVPTSFDGYCISSFFLPPTIGIEEVLCLGEKTLWGVFKLRSAKIDTLELWVHTQEGKEQKIKPLPVPSIP